MNSSYLHRQTVCPEFCQGYKEHSPGPSAQQAFIVRKGPFNGLLQLLLLCMHTAAQGLRSDMLPECHYSPQGLRGKNLKKLKSSPSVQPPLSTGSSLQELSFKSPEPVRSHMTSQTSSLTLWKPGSKLTTGREDDGLSLRRAGRLLLMGETEGCPPPLKKERQVSIFFYGTKVFQVFFKGHNFL